MDKPLTYYQAGMMPQEETLAREIKGKKLKIGLLAEVDIHETRVPITPQGAELLIQGGHIVFVEKDAGLGSRFSDRDYTEAGATVVEHKKDVFEADVLLKISPLSDKELKFLRNGQTLICSIHLATKEENYYRELMSRKTTAIGFELLQDRYGEYPVLRSMCEIAGTVSVGIGSRYLSNYLGGKGILLGGITGVSPAELVILGAGTAAEYAARTALGMGAVVKVFDFAIPRLKMIKHRIGQEIFTSVMHPPVLRKALHTADLVISTLQRLDTSGFYLVPEDMVMEMKAGSVLMDIHIDQGSSFETGRMTDQKNPIYTEHHVIHYMAPNLTAQVGRTASIALSNVLMPLLLNEGRCGSIQQLIMEDLGVRNGVYLYNGILTNEIIGNNFRIPYKDIDLLLAAF